MKRLDGASLLEALKARKYSDRDQYLAMYSSWCEGIVTDPCFMVLPIDDHMVHRGDGVFEAFKALEGQFYLLNEHLTRLQGSLKSLGIQIKQSMDDLKEIIFETARASGSPDLLIRLYVSRGPGGFSTSPQECIEAQVYCVATSLKSLPREFYSQGVKLCRSHVPMKDPWLATVKSCNYLPNVMMKREALERGYDFSVNFDEDGWLGEGSTENIVILTKENVLRIPSFDRTLRGTTLLRVMDLAQKLVEKGTLERVELSQVNEADLVAAQEVFMVGTTIDVLPVVEYEGKPLAQGQVGNVAKQLLAMLQNEMKTDTQFLTRF